MDYWLIPPEHFFVAGCLVSVSVAAIRRETGEPAFAVAWGERPERLTPADCAEFDRLKRQAVAALRVQLAAEPSSSEPAADASDRARSDEPTRGAPSAAANTGKRPQHAAGLALQQRWRWT